MEHLFKFLGTNRGMLTLLVILIIVASVLVWALKNGQPLTIGPVGIGNKPPMPVKDTHQVINGDQFGTVNGDVIKDHGVKNVYSSRKDSIIPKQP